MSETTFAAIVLVFCTPLGWIGMLALGLAISFVVEAFR